MSQVRNSPQSAYADVLRVVAALPPTSHTRRVVGKIPPPVLHSDFLVIAEELTRAVFSEIMNSAATKPTTPKEAVGGPRGSPASNTPKVANDGSNGPTN